MSNILASLTSASNSFTAIEKAMQVVSNDTTNATTPGYARQTQVLEANAFSNENGGAGGVSAGAVLNSRDQYSEMTVQAAQTDVTYASTTAQNLKSLEPLFTLSNTSATDSSIGGSLNSLFNSFSQLTTSPNDLAARQAVISAASNVAASFNSTYTALSNAESSAVTGATSTVAAINTIVSDIQQINIDKRREAAASTDPGTESRLYSDLENLSKLVNFSTVQQSDGTTSLFLGGQSALLVGVSQYNLSATITGSATAQPQVKLTDANGIDVSALATGGQLGAQVKLANQTLPGYMSQINNLAQAVADKVNVQLMGGKDKNGAAGTAMFAYNPTAAAQSLSVSGITATQVAAASSSGPGGNDNAVALAKLQSAPIATLGNYTFTQAYGTLASTVGSDSANAQNNETTQQQLLAQAQTLRANVSGVSLDQEATLLSEYQQAYEATSKLITVIDEMVKTALGLLPSA